MNCSLLRKFSQSVELRTVPADYAPPNLGSAFILGSLGNLSSTHLNATKARQRKLYKDINVCKRSLTAALNPSARRKRNDWRAKTDAEILELMQRRKISLHALEQNVGNITRATYLYKMITLPTNKFPRTKPRYKHVRMDPKTAAEDMYDPYKEFAAVANLKNRHLWRSSSDPVITTPTRKTRHMHPQMEGHELPLSFTERADFEYYEAGGKDSPNAVSARHLFPHLTKINNQVPAESFSPVSTERAVPADMPKAPERPPVQERALTKVHFGEDEQPKSPPNEDNQPPSYVGRQIFQKGLPVRYRGFAGARVIQSNAQDMWKNRDTPSQLRVSWTFPHRQKGADTRQRPKTSDI